jgi:hypothetical protein
MLRSSQGDPTGIGRSATIKRAPPRGGAARKVASLPGKSDRRGRFRAKPGTRRAAHGTWRAAHGTSRAAHGTWRAAHGTSRAAHASTHVVHRASPVRALVDPPSQRQTVHPSPPELSPRGYPERRRAASERRERGGTRLFEAEIAGVACRRGRVAGGPALPSTEAARLRVPPRRPPLARPTESARARLEPLEASFVILDARAKCTVVS